MKIQVTPHSTFDNMLLNAKRANGTGSMGFFYFDESIHSRAQFSIGAFVYSELNLQSRVADALRESGLTPQVDEFKSGNRMEHNPTQVLARARLRSIVHEHCQIAVVVAPNEPREALGIEALEALSKVLQTNRFRSACHQVFLDQGLFKNEASGKNAVPLTLNGFCSFSFEQDSRDILGVQVADLVAHTCAGMLLAELGLKNKKVKAGENSGYDPNLDIELEFELWASIRYNFFSAELPPSQQSESQLDCQVDVESRGLHIAHSCKPRVRAAALSRFGKMYLGCIH